jgi:outer membrane protein assembly factor BamD
MIVRARDHHPMSARLPLSLMLLLFATACATVSGKRAPAPPGSAAELYEAGRSASESGDQERAIELFGKLEVYYPDDKHAVQARIESVYAYYLGHDYESAAAAAQRFIRKYPDHPNIDYLLYLRGLAHFDEATLDFAALPADVPRDRPPPSADLALEDFSELIARYPKGRYSDDARNRIARLRQLLAEFDLQTAKLYLSRGEYANAGVRARAVMDDYPDSPSAKEAATIVDMARHMLHLDGIMTEPPQGEGAPAKPPQPNRPQGQTPTDGDSASSAVVEPQREAWILGQDPKRYTIQLSTLSREAVLRSFIRRHRLETTAYFQTKVSGQRRYSLLYGTFDTLDDARAAAEKLPAELRRERPWIRRMADVQALIRRGDEAVTP